MLAWKRIFFWVDEQNTILEPVIPAAFLGECAQHCRGQSREHADVRERDIDRFPAALPVYTHRGTTPDRKPELTVGPALALVLVERPDPSGRLVGIAKDTPRVVLQEDRQ